MSNKNYVHQLDAKNRIRIPAKLKEQLGENYSITVGAGGCLNVYTSTEIEKVKKELQSINDYRESDLKAARFILYNIWDAEEDNQGRILLPENLRIYAKLKKNLVIYKGPNCIEIWAEEIWNDYMNNLNFNDLADAVDSLRSRNKEKFFFSK